MRLKTADSSNSTLPTSLSRDNLSAEDSLLYVCFSSCGCHVVPFLAVAYGMSLGNQLDTLPRIHINMVGAIPAYLMTDANSVGRLFRCLMSPMLYAYFVSTALPFGTQLGCIVCRSPAPRFNPSTERCMPCVQCRILCRPCVQALCH